MILGMALTSQVKAELASLPEARVSARKAEAIAMLRFAGGIHIVAGRIVVEAEFDTGAAATRLRATVTDLYGLDSELVVINTAGMHKGSRYMVRAVGDGESLARQTGLIDQHGRPVRGLPPAVIGGAQADQVAAWRGAFLARGCLTEPGRSVTLEVTCPGSEAALALVGAARRLSIAAKSREVRGADRVVLRDPDAISALLVRMGAHQTALIWEDRRLRREVRGTANRLANFDDANLRRSARAAVTASVRVQRAMQILGDDVPAHLRVAGELRMAHQQVSLEDLGQMHEPPLTKDAMAGRIRRLLAMADKAAADLGVPDTTLGLSAEHAI